MSIPRYIEHITFERKYSTHTQLAYSRDLQSFQQFCQETFEEQDIDQLPYTIIRSWIIALVDQGKSNRTVNRKISVLRSYYNFLLRTEIITVSPLRKHIPLKETKKVHIPFSEKEMAALLEGNHFEDSYKGVLQKTIIELLYSTGMRRAELIALKSSDVSFGTATLRVLGKRNKERLIPILSSLATTLQEYQKLAEQNLAFEYNSFFIQSEKGGKCLRILFTKP